MSELRITLIGAGRMGMAMLRGWLKTGDDLRIHVVKRTPSKELSSLTEAKRITLATTHTGLSADIVILAVKPQTFYADPSQFSAFVGENTGLVSVMAGVSLHKLSEAFGSEKIVRAMPNTPGSIGQGVTLLSALDAVGAPLMTRISGLFAPLGHVEGPMPEADLQKGTAVSGCGPAYVFYFAEMLAKAAQTSGLHPDVAERLARQTVIGAAAQIATEEDTSLEALRKAVASPGGVTQAALDVMLKDQRLDQMMEEALSAAIARDKELAN